MFLFRIKCLIVTALFFVSGLSLAQETYHHPHSKPTEFIEIPEPESDNNKYKSARQVMDRKSLEHFVNGSRHHLENDYDRAIKDFQNREGPWRSASVYVFIIDDQGTIVFHGTNPQLEGENLMNRHDANKVFMVRDMIKKAKNGGGFVEYLWRNPAREVGDETEKVSYAKTFMKDGTELIVGSGFYPGCGNHVVDLSEEIKLWSGQEALQMGSPFVGLVPTGQKIELTLTPLADTKFVHPPEKAPMEDTFAGTAQLLIVLPDEGTGTYMVSLGSRAWVDIVDLKATSDFGTSPGPAPRSDYTLVTSEKFSMKPTCQTILKTVGFKLTAGNPYVLQISGSTQEKVTLMVSRQSPSPSSQSELKN